MDVDDDDNPIDVLESDWCSVEIIFGEGKSQKAHRFTIREGSGVNYDGGAGVAVGDYVYADYVDVPFEVWDVTNNRQLMVSFRDQAGNGIFDLVARDGADPTIGREYLFVNAVTYDENNPNSNIAKTGGRAYKQLYFFWPTLAEGGNWNANDLPNSKIIINYGSQVEQTGKVSKIADAYGSVNAYDQGAGFGETQIPGLHPDHHALVIIPGASENDDFTIINTNDGGVSISENSGADFEMKINSYHTTQFYGVSKKHGANEYFGGMQDNGSWQSPKYTSAYENSKYFFRLAGDGFETIWNYTNPEKMIGSIYYNAFMVSTNGGRSWTAGDGGINEDGPFLTKISSSKSKSDVLFAVGNLGVWRSTDFASSFWRIRTLGENWAPSGVNSSHRVKVSLANDNTVWAGASMSSEYDYSSFVSEDGGETFSAIAEYTDIEMNAYFSGFATHPTESNTAFALYSLQGKPKVLRTEDLGQTWTDLSGFSALGKGVSSNGFPDVVVNDLIVMPYNTDIIWVGTDIGIFESTDAGLNWHILASDLPYVSIYQMQIVDDQVVLATHGRGIWTVTIPELKKVPVVTNLNYKGLGVLNLDVEVFDLCEKLEIYMNGVLHNTFTEGFDANKINTLEITAAEDGNQNVYVKAYFGSEVFQSNSTNFVLNTVGIKILNKEINKLEIYPNPSNGIVNFELKSSDINKDYSVKILDLSGKEVFVNTGVANFRNQINASELKNGQYIIMLYINKVYYAEKLLIKK